MNSNITLRIVLDANKLTGSNFLNWYLNIRIVLKQERELYILENPILFALHKDVDEEVMNVYQRHIDDNEQAAYVMLASMTPELRK
jgi:hypothetical protein